VQPVVDLVQPHNGVRAGADLDAGQVVPVDVVLLYEPTTLAEDVDPTLLSCEDLVLANGGLGAK